MFTSRITTRAVAAAAAAFLVTGAAAQAAGASTTAPALTGPAVATTSEAGYTATGRDFRYIQALITVPDLPPLGNASPHEYIELAGVDQSVRLGITYQGSSWEVFVASRDNSLFPIHYYLHGGTIHPGDGVLFSIFFDQAGNELHFAITPPSTDGGPIFFKTHANGPLFTAASALDDWTYTSWAPYPLPPWVSPFQINEFLRGALTTYSGTRGSFDGAWTTSEIEATSNGLLFPAGTVRVSPNALFGDGQVANGAVRPADAFTVRARG